MNIVIFIIILLVLVVVHEFGHFFSAKKFGIRVDEFGFGFPPKLFGIKYGETEYTFNLLPLGGFVKIYGENPEEDSSVSQTTNPNDPEAKRSFVNNPKWKQAIVLFAGVFANFLLAWLLFSIGFMSGLPTSVGSGPTGYALNDVHLVILSVLKDSPADISGLEVGDKITSVSSASETLEEINPDSLKSFIVSHPGEKIQIGYLRGNDPDVHTVEITSTERNAGEGPTIGIAMDEIGTAKLPVLVAVWEGLRMDWNMTKYTALGLYDLIRDSLHGRGKLAAVTGPVGMVGIVGDAYRFGFAYLLSFAALISINLAIINLLPFPALDGGRLFFLLIEKIKGSRINPKVANTANMVGFSILILLMLIVTYHDIVHLF